MPGNVHPVPRPIWTPLPRAGCRNLEARVLPKLPDLAVVQLRFAPHGTIDEHTATWDIDVVCLEGEGTTTVDGAAEPIRAGETIRWPAGKRHRLFTAESTMVTLMLEHVSAAAQKR